VAGKFTKVVDAECCDLLGLVGTRIFTNLHHLRPELDLLDNLCRAPNVPAANSSDNEATTMASRVQAAVERLLAIYEWSRTRANPASASVDSDEEFDHSSGKDGSGSGEPDSGKVANTSARGCHTSPASNLDFDVTDESGEEAP
jgi:hypothetical protein